MIHRFQRFVKVFFTTEIGVNMFFSSNVFEGFFFNHHLGGRLGRNSRLFDAVFEIRCKLQRRVLVVLTCFIIILCVDDSLEGRSKTS